MRIGQSHRDVAVVLLGSFSRWVNHLEDEDMLKERTKKILKALSNLVPLGQYLIITIIS